MLESLSPQLPVTDAAGEFVSSSNEKSIGAAFSGGATRRNR
jgi:hypothetical protein